jgi:hypothetical protein
LRVNNLVIDDEDAREEADPFGKLALEIIDEERKSAMKPGDQAEILKTRKKYELRGEMTFVEVMWKLITGEDRSIKQEDEQSIVNDEGLFTRPWKTDFLDKNWDTLFKSTCIPKVDMKDDVELQTLIYQYPRVATPKPDLTYALELDAFQSVKKVVQRKDIEELAMVSPFIYFPFFVIEFKSHQSTIEEAETQACRSGAAIVYSMRKLKAIADILDEVHAHDTGSFVFSLAMVPATAHLFVHWATVGEDENTVYHMSFVKAYTLRTGSNVAALHHDINNILEWGVGQRVVYITDLLMKISKAESREMSSWPSEER